MNPERAVAEKLLYLSVVSELKARVLSFSVGHEGTT